jgi:DNA polymerase III subunit gamma/tau
LRLVQAGKLISIEEALSDLGSGGAPLPPVRKAPLPPAPPPKSAAPPAPSPQPPNPSAPWRDRLHTSLLEMGMQFTADAVEHSQVTESNGELQFVTPEEFSLAMNEKDILKVVQKIAGRPMRIKIVLGKPDAVATPLAKPKDDVSERALAHPEVKRFQELFPDAQVRVVRNLKE